MEIRVIEEPQAQPRRMSPEELAADRKTVTVWLERPITLRIENVIVTFPEGESEAVCSVANVLVEAGAQLVGSQVPPRAEKTRGQQVAHPYPRRDCRLHPLPNLKSFCAGETTPFVGGKVSLFLRRKHG
jgi:hypothetical protein